MLKEPCLISCLNVLFLLFLNHDFTSKQVLPQDSVMVNFLLLIMFLRFDVCVSPKFFMYK